MRLSSPVLDCSSPKKIGWVYLLSHGVAFSISTAIGSLFPPRALHRARLGFGTSWRKRQWHCAELDSRPCSCHRRERLRAERVTAATDMAYSIRAIWVPNHSRAAYQPATDLQSPFVD